MTNWTKMHEVRAYIDNVLRLLILLTKCNLLFFVFKQRQAIIDKGLLISGFVLFNWYLYFHHSQMKVQVTLLVQFLSFSFVASYTKGPPTTGTHSDICQTMKPGHGSTKIKKNPFSITLDTSVKSNIKGMLFLYPRRII